MTHENSHGTLPVIHMGESIVVDDIRREMILPSSITIVETPSATTINEYRQLAAISSNKYQEADDKIPFSIFSKRQKIMIVITVSISCLFSPLSANIYFPAMKVIQNDMQIAERMVNLTVTMYMIFQAISPSFWGSLADSWGRRPVYIMTFSIYIIACVGLACTRNYATLLVLRMIQAFGSSSAVAVGAGSIGDISTPSERGGYLGIYCMCSMLGQVAGPFLGGILSHEFGWRYIFWVLTMAVLPLWLVQVFFLPETLRSLVGNGSGYANPTPWQFWKHKQELRKAARKNAEDEEEKATIMIESTLSFYSAATTACNNNNADKEKEERCIKITTVANPSHFFAIPPPTKNPIIISQEKDTTEKRHASTRNRFLVLPNPFQSLAYLKEKDVAAVLSYNSIQYASLYCVVSSITELFTTIYGINEFQVGLCFLANGFGASLGSFTSGRILDWKFRKVALSLGLNESQMKRHCISPEFPLEKARMDVTWIWGIAFNVAIILYGWSLYYKFHIALPIALNFILSFTSTSIYNSTNTLLVDLFPGNSAAIVASHNLTRCLLGAGAVLIVQPGIELIGIGWFFTTVSLFLFLSRITMVLELKYGPKWREERRLRLSKSACNIMI